MEDLETCVSGAEEAWTRFCRNYHQQYRVTKPGLNGSEASVGQHMLPLRSRMLKVGQCGLTAIESYNNSGELPDANRLASWLENMDGDQADFISTAFLLMVSLDANFLMNTGESTTVLQALNHFNETEGQKGTAVSILSKKRTILGTTRSQDQEDVSIPGPKSKKDPGSMTRAQRHRKLMMKEPKASTTKKSAGKKKPSRKKARKRARS